MLYDERHDSTKRIAPRIEGMETMFECLMERPGTQMLNGGII
jgi:hypothetical protein